MFVCVDTICNQDSFMITALWYNFYASIHLLHLDDLFIWFVVPVSSAFLDFVSFRWIFLGSYASRSVNRVQDVVDRLRSHVATTSLSLLSRYSSNIARYARPRQGESSRTANPDLPRGVNLDLASYHSEPSSQSDSEDESNLIFWRNWDGDQMACHVLSLCEFVIGIIQRFSKYTSLVFSWLDDWYQSDSV